MEKRSAPWPTITSKERQYLTRRDYVETCHHKTGRAYLSRYAWISESRITQLRDFGTFHYQSRWSLIIRYLGQHESGPNGDELARSVFVICANVCTRCFRNLLDVKNIERPSSAVDPAEVKKGDDSVSSNPQPSFAVLIARPLLTAIIGVQG